MFCHECRETIPDISRYCLHCGVLLNLSGIRESKEYQDDAEIDWDNRVLCSDGNCTGTIANGKCRVCGMTTIEVS